MVIVISTLDACLGLVAWVIVVVLVGLGGVLVDGLLSVAGLRV